MKKSKKGGSTEPTKKDEEWKEICKNCEILKKGSNCFYGCEIIKAALKKEKRT